MMMDIKVKSFLISFAIALLVPYGSCIPIKEESKPANDTNDAINEETLISNPKAYLKPAEVRVKIENLDSRNAYINNQYVTDEPSEESTNDAAATFYQIVQQQMHALASAKPNVQVYSVNKGDRNKPISGNYNSQNSFNGNQNTPPRPIFTSNKGYPSQNEKMEYDEDPDNENDYEDSDDNSQEQQVSVPANYNFSTQIKEKPNKTATTQNPYGSNPNNNESRPFTRPSLRPGNRPSRLPKPLPLDTNQSLEWPTEEPVFDQKRRKSFKIIHMGSQLFTTPLADLMVRLSIGVAPPSLGDKSLAFRGKSLANNNNMNNLLIQKVLKALTEN